MDKTSAKILVLGDSGVGKSSLIHLICHSVVLSSAQWTIGCSIEVKLQDDHFLEFWDVGGSRTHKLARSFLYQDYHGIILVFDATNKKSRTNLNEWLMEVTLKPHDKDLYALDNINVPIITIATKKDLLPYGNETDINENTKNYIVQHSSVVEINEAFVGSNHVVHRRNLSKPSLSPLLPSINLSRENLSSSDSSSLLNAPLLNNSLLYVNTQDPITFSPGTGECNKLISFYKQVIDRRNKRF